LNLRKTIDIDREGICRQTKKKLKREEKKGKKKPVLHTREG
jgi:hypothetical protein